MLPSASFSDYDYLVIGFDGKKLVKGKKEFPITDEEYNKMFPEHRLTGCTECTFAYSLQAIVDTASEKSKKRAASGKVVDMGQFTMPNFSGHIEFYLFKCSSCNQLSANYCPGGGVFVYCNHCGHGWVSTETKPQILQSLLKDGLLVLLVAPVVGLVMLVDACFGKKDSGNP